MKWISKKNDLSIGKDPKLMLNSAGFMFIKCRDWPIPIRVTSDDVKSFIFAKPTLTKPGKVICCDNPNCQPTPWVYRSGDYVLPAIIPLRFGDKKDFDALADTLIANGFLVKAE